MNNMTTDIFQKVSDRIASIGEVALETWEPPCLCSAPGKRVECISCVHFQSKVLEIQGELSTVEDENFPSVSCPSEKIVYPDSVKQQAIELLQQGHKLVEVGRLCGGVHESTIRRWADNAGFPKRERSFPEEIKQKCLTLHKEGIPTSQISQMTGMTPHRITRWARDEGLTLNHTYYAAMKRVALQFYQEGKPVPEIAAITGVKERTISGWAIKAGLRPTLAANLPETKQSCLDLYLQGVDTKDIAALTQVPVATIQRWAKRANICRPSHFYSPEAIQHSLELYREHQSYNKVASLTGIPCGTVRRWVVENNLADEIPLRSYSDEEKQRCLSLHSEGNNSTQISKITGIPTGFIYKLLAKQKVIDKAATFSDSQQKFCLFLFYNQSKSLVDIASESSIDVDVIEFWIKQSKGAGGRAYSPEIRYQCLELYQSGYSSNDISELMGVSASSINNWVKHEGIKLQNHFFISDVKQKEIERCLTLLAEGKTHDQVAEMTSIPKNTFLRWIHQAKRSVPSPQS